MAVLYTVTMRLKDQKGDYAFSKLMHFSYPNTREWTGKHCCISRIKWCKCVTSSMFMLTWPQNNAAMIRHLCKHLIRLLTPMRTLRSRYYLKLWQGLRCRTLETWKKKPFHQNRLQRSRRYSFRCFPTEPRHRFHRRGYLDEHDRQWNKRHGIDRNLPQRLGNRQHPIYRFRRIRPKRGHPHRPPRRPGQLLFRYGKERNQDLSDSVERFVFRAILFTGHSSRGDVWPWLCGAN